MQSNGHIFDIDLVSTVVPTCTLTTRVCPSFPGWILMILPNGQCPRAESGKITKTISPSLISLWGYCHFCGYRVSLFCGVTVRQKDRRLWLVQKKYDFVVRHLSKFGKWLEGGRKRQGVSKSVHLLLFWRHFYCSLCTGGVKILNFLLTRRPLGVNSGYLGLCM